MFSRPPGMMEQAYVRLKEAAYLFGRVCDDLNAEACSCLSLMARVAYLQGQPTEVYTHTPQIMASNVKHRIVRLCNSLLPCASLPPPTTHQARSVQLKAVVISERVLGFDHPNTIQQYVSTTLSSATHSKHHRLLGISKLPKDQ